MARPNTSPISRDSRSKLIALGDVQMQDQGCDAGAKRRAGLHASGRGRDHGLVATRADTAMPVDAGCDRLDRGQIDVIIGVDVARIGRAERVVAMQAGRVDFWPFDGGRLGLSGVFDGTASLASSSLMRALSAAICKAFAWISVIRPSRERESRTSTSLPLCEPTSPWSCQGSRQTGG
jgi:hypothetical protein